MKLAWRQRLLRGLVLGVSIAIAFVAVEIALTIRYRAERGPGSWVQAAGIGSAYVHHARPGHGDINNLGLRRGEDTSLSRIAGVPRVLSYGDSIAQGFNITSDETYSNLLEVRLREHLRKPVEVLNMHRGHSPTIHAFHIRRDVPMLAPDAVLLEIELLNDVPDEAMVLASGSDEYGLPEQLTAARYVVGLDGHLLSPASGRPSIWERTALYSKFHRWLGRQRAKSLENPVFADGSDTAYYSAVSERHLLTADALERGFERMFDSIAGIHRYLDAQGIAFLLVILPSRDSYGAEARSVGARRLLDRAEARAPELELPTLSPRVRLGTAGGAELYMDFCHPTAAGHEAIAAALFDSVLELIGP